MCITVYVHVLYWLFGLMTTRPQAPAADDAAAAATTTTTTTTNVHR